jgi:hypothetical protein
MIPKEHGQWLSSRCVYFVQSGKIKIADISFPYTASSMYVSIADELCICEKTYLEWHK